MSLQIPVTADDVGDGKQVPLASASGLICRGGSSGLASCAPLIWTRPEPYSGIFTMPPERNFLFIFFSLGRNSLQPVSYDFLPHSSSYLPRTLNICVVLERAAAVLLHPVTADSAASPYFLNSSSVSSCRTTQCFALYFSWAGISPGAAGLDWGAVGSSHQQSV